MSLAPSTKQFQCPLCGYHGPFSEAPDMSGPREHAMCPKCAAFERHRVLYLTLLRIPEAAQFARMSVLHFAPEPQLTRLLRKQFAHYASADLRPNGVDFRADLRALPLASESYDVVIACHVLEHIREDAKAIAEIRRVLRPGGIAILQVPVLGKKTVEYAKPNLYEWGHVRAPGEDYFDRYAGVFSRVVTYRSSEFDDQYQPFIYEDRSVWPEKLRDRPTTPGRIHEDFVPVCYA